MNRGITRLAVTAALWLLVNAVVTAASDKPSRVTVIEAVAETLREEIPLVGTAEALHDTALSPRVAGVVEQLFVSEGQFVEAGDRILTLDPALAEIEVASAQARLAEAIARHKDAVRRKAEYQSLTDRNAVATTSLASAVADEEAARALVDRQRAELRRSRELLTRHTLSAPFTGVVAEKQAEVGQWVDQDAPVIRLVDLDHIRVRASLPQRYYRRIAKDSSLRIVFDALPGETFLARPAALVAVGNRDTRSFPLLIDLDNRGHRIAAGMSARIFIELAGSESKALLLPQDAIVLRPDGQRIVWRVIEVDGEHRVESVPLLRGRSQGSRVEILESTLKAGERVVLLGNENLRPDQVVLPTEPME